MDFRRIVAEEPYDQMGSEFAEEFGGWLDRVDLGSDGDLGKLAFDLFRRRLRLAEKFHTYFATQVTAGGTRDLWRERYLGLGNEPCYSFASLAVPRTRRFHRWTEQVNARSAPTGERIWDLGYAPLPSLPGVVRPRAVMPIWGHTYYPRFTARTGGAFACRRLLYGCDDGGSFHLFEHPRSRWIAQIRAEATTFWNVARDGANDAYTRYGALASFEWLWFWMNPFTRSGALTADALSLAMQKHIGACIRPGFYHQDCEALLMGFDAYVEKRARDMEHGFVPAFAM